MTTRSCGACYKPYRGKARSAVLVGGSSSRRALVCPRCAAGALLVVVELGDLENTIADRLEEERRRVAAEKRRQRRKVGEERGDAIADLLTAGVDLLEADLARGES